MFLYTEAMFDREIVSTWWDLLCNLTLLGAHQLRKNTLLYGPWLLKFSGPKIWDPKVYWNFWSMALGTWNIWELNVGPETQTGNLVTQVSQTRKPDQVPLMWVTSTSNAFTGRYLAPIVLVERCKLSQHSLGAVSRFQQAVRPHPPPTEDFMWLNLWQVIPRYAYSLFIFDHHHWWCIIMC